MTEDEDRPVRHPSKATHSHEGEAIYEAGAFLGAPADEPIPEREVSLTRRVLNWRTIGSVIFAIVLLALTFRTLGVNLGDTVELILGANVGLLVLAFVAYYATFPIRAFRWRYILAKVGTQVRFLDPLEILYISWFVNCLVPAKLGDLYRAYLLKADNGASASKTVGTIFIERIADIIVIFALALAAGYWSFRGRSMPGVDVIFILGFVVAILLIGVIGCAPLLRAAIDAVPPAAVRGAVGPVPRRQHWGAHPLRVAGHRRHDGLHLAARGFAPLLRHPRPRHPGCRPRHQRLGLRRARGGTPDRDAAHARWRRLR